jgi:hypothetical protein
MSDYREFYRGRRVMSSSTFSSLSRAPAASASWSGRLRDGLTRTLDYYRKHMPHYVPTTASQVAAL